MGGGASPSAASPRRGQRGPAAEAAGPGPAEGGDSPRTEARKARAANEWAVAPGARGLSQVLRKRDKGEEAMYAQQRGVLFNTLGST